MRPENYRWQNIKEYKGKMNSAQSALVRLLWLLYRPGSNHNPHMYPTPSRAWGMGGGQRVCQGSTGLAPLPLDSTPTHSSLQQFLLWENDDVGIILFYFVIYNSVGAAIFLKGQCHENFNPSKVFLPIASISRRYSNVQKNPQCPWLCTVSMTP